MGWTKGNKRGPQSEELRKKRSQLLLGHIVSDETRGKISNTEKGKIVSSETKEKIRQISLGRKMPTDRIKGKTSRWRGGKINRLGYNLLRIPGHHRAMKTGYVFEHIVIWEQIYGKRVPKGYLIHHLNGIKDDNRPDNLIAIKRGEHSQLAEPYKKRIRELEIEITRLKQLNLFKR